MFGANELLEQLRYLDRVEGNALLPVIRVRIDEPHFDWMTLGACSDCGCPGLDVGQDHDCRYSTDRGDGLHGQVFSQAGYVDFHLDRVDACRDLPGHVAHDTKLVEGGLGGALTGAAVGAALGALLDGKKGATAGASLGALLGGIGGAVTGASTPRAPRRVHEFRDVMGLPPNVTMGLPSWT